MDVSARAGLCLVLSALVGCASFRPAADLPLEASAAAGGRHVGHFSSQSGLNYLLTFPADYDANPSRAWPLLIFLHSLEERGERLGAVIENPKGEGPGLARFALAKEDFAFVTLSPLCPERTHWFSIHDRLDQLLEEVVRDHRIDRRRIMLTGVSMGGMGTWSWSMARPEWFAAAAPIAGGIYTPPMSSDVSPLKAVPVWAFHDRKDPSIPYEKEQGPIERLRQAGGEAKLTATETGRHSIHGEVFGEGALFDWFEAQAKPGR